MSFASVRHEQRNSYGDYRYFRLNLLASMFSIPFFLSPCVHLAMTSCNDVIAIFLFGVLLGVVFSTGNLTQQLLQGPVGIVMGNFNFRPANLF